MYDSEWETRRAHFNHDWHQNKYLRHLGDFILRLEKKDDFGNARQYFIQEIFPQWTNKKPEVEWLVTNYIKYNSPSKYFELDPLAHCPVDIKHWLQDAVQEVWLIKYEVNTWIQTVTAILKDIDKYFITVKQQVNFNSNISMDDHIALFKELYQQGLRLRDCLAMHPALRG